MLLLNYRGRKQTSPDVQPGRICLSRQSAGFSSRNWGRPYKSSVPTETQQCVTMTTETTGADILPATLALIKIIFVAAQQQVQVRLLYYSTS